MEQETILILLSVLGWIATTCRALGMYVKGDNKVKFWTSCGNFVWLIIGLMQWICLNMSMTLFVSNFICIAVYGYTYFKSKSDQQQ